MTDHIPAVVRAGDVEIDVRQECVRRRGVEQRLRQKSFQVLLYLIQNRQRVVSKGELFDAVWSGAAVTEDTLVQSIVEIRKALGDDPRDPRFIRTMPKSGYRFVAPVAEPAVAAFEYETVRHVAVELAEDDGAVSPRSWIYVATVAAAVAVIIVLSIELIRSRSGFASVPKAEQRPPVLDAMTNNLAAYRWYTQGVTLAQQLHDEKAIAAFEEAIKLDPGFAMAYARIGYAYGVTSNFPERGRPYIDRALALHERVSDKDRYYIEAWHAILNEQYASAIDIFQTLLARYPTEVEARCNLGLLLASEERLGEAVGVLEQARLIDPTAQVYNILGSLYRQQRRVDDAVAAHQRAVALAPDEANLHDSLALSWQFSGNFEKALSEYDAALRLDPAFQVARIHRGNTLFEMGRYREALAEFDQVVRRAASAMESARAYESQAWILRSQGQLAAADAAARRAAAADRGYITALLVVSADRGDLATARGLRNTFDSTLHPGRGARPSLRFSYFFNGYEALKSGRTDEAIDLFRHALQYQTPVYSIAGLDDCLANALLSLGRYQDAALEYERVVALNPHDALSHFHLADSYDHLGRKDKARREYGRFLDLWRSADSDLPQIVAARKRLAAS